VKQPPLFVSHDGAIDELVALALLAVSTDVKLRGVSLVHGDCLAEPTWALQRRLLDRLGRPDLRASLSNARGWNPFPWEYRRDSLRLEEIAELQGLPVPPPPSRPDGERHLIEELERGPLTLLVLGPLTPVQLALEGRPDLHSRIERIVWSGGAIDVPGNIDPATLPGLPPNRRAEWNVYCDPFALDWLLGETEIPLTLIPLDVTDRAPLAEDFLADLARIDTRVARFASQAYALIENQPLYRLWDMTAAAWALAPELFRQPERFGLAVDLWGNEQGATRRSADGREVDAVLDFADGAGPLHAWILDRSR